MRTIQMLNRDNRSPTRNRRKGEKNRLLPQRSAETYSKYRHELIYLTNLKLGGLAKKRGNRLQVILG
jgi:hypothetical protein